MSVDLNVFLDPARMITPARWAQAVKDAGFEVEMDPDFDPRTFSGFLPCKYKGQYAGFEYSYHVLQGGELASYGIGDASRPGCMTFSTRSDFRDAATSTICAAVLASITDGVLRDADGETRIPADRALAWAKDGEEGMQDFIAEQDARPAEPAVSPPTAPPPTSKPWWKFW